MAIVDVENNFSPISYNCTILPYGITEPILHFTDEDPISPPGSPRPEGEVEYVPRIIFHGDYYHRLMFIPYSPTIEMKERQHKFPKYPSKKNMTKYLRRSGKLKQPGGASCNQRR